jgi:hypothetical protein
MRLPRANTISSVRRAAIDASVGVCAAIWATTARSRAIAAALCGAIVRWCHLDFDQPGLAQTLLYNVM